MTDADLQREVRLRLQLALELTDQWPIIEADITATLRHLAIASTKATDLAFRLKSAAHEAQRPPRYIGLVPAPAPASPPSPPSNPGERGRAAGAAGAARPAIQSALALDVADAGPPRRRG